MIQRSDVDAWFSIALYGRRNRLRFGSLGALQVFSDTQPEVQLHEGE